MTEKRPSYLIIGAMKSGTTSVYLDMAQHPQVFVPSVKEPGDLNSDAVLTEPGLSRYLKLFKASPPGAWIGEGSTTYTKVPEFEGAPERAKHVLGPDVRLIFIGRDPVARLRSHYRHEVQKGILTRSLEAELYRHPPLMDVSRYDMQLARWLAVFPREQILVLRFEDYQNSPAAFINRIWGHLGLSEPAGATYGIKANASLGKRTPKGLLRRFLATDFYSRMLKTFIPRALRDRAKLAIVPRGQIEFDDALSPQTEARLREELDTETQNFRHLAASIDD